MTLFGYRVPMMASLIVWCVIWESSVGPALMFLIPPLSSVLVAAAFDLVQTGTWQSAALDHAAQLRHRHGACRSWSASRSAC